MTKKPPTKTTPPETQPKMSPRAAPAPGSSVFEPSVSALSLRAEMLALGIFGGRIAISELILFSIFLTDILMLGIIGELSLSAALLVNSTFIIFFVTSLGFLQGALPLASAHWEQGDRDSFFAVTRTSIIMAMMIGLLVVITFLIYPSILSLIGYRADLTSEIWNYLRFIIPGLGFAMIYIAVRNGVIATGNSHGFMTISLSAFGLNAALNYCLGFGLDAGSLRIPAMGISGIGLASSIVECLLLVGFWLLLRRTGFSLFAKPENGVTKLGSALASKVDFGKLRCMMGQLTRIGAPIAVIFFVDTTLFSGVLIVVGRHDVLGMAALALIFEWVALAVMIPVGLSEALVQRVSMSKSSGNMARQLPLLVRAACILTFGYIGVLAIIQFGIGINIPGLFLVDPSAHPQLVTLLDEFALIGFALAAMNAFIIAIAGILRGILDVMTSMIIVVISYWGIGIGATIVVMEFLGLGTYYALQAVLAGTTLATVTIAFRLGKTVGRLSAG